MREAPAEHATGTSVSSGVSRAFGMSGAFAVALVITGAALAEHAVVAQDAAYRAYALVALLAGVGVYVVARLRLRAALTDSGVVPAPQITEARAIDARVPEQV